MNKIGCGVFHSRFVFLRMLYIHSYQELPVPQNAYEQKAIDFCKKWLSGKQAFTLHTSGSTGIPKSLDLTREQMIASAELTGKTFGLSQGDTALVCVNIDYIAGVMMLVRGMTLGLKLVIVPPAGNPFVKYPETLNVDYDFVALVPLQIQQIIEDGGVGLQKLNAMKAVIVGGAAVNLALQDQIKQLKVPTFATYGMTETVSHIAIKKLNGIPQNTDEFEVLSGVEIKTDQRSCLAIKAAASNHEWIFTNDVVELTEGKKFKIVGRYDNIINSGGVKIQLEEVEKQLLAIPNAESDDWILSKRFFAWGIPDDNLGQKLVIFVENKEVLPETKELFLKKIQENLPKYKSPKEIYFVNEFLETPTGKIDKRAVASHFGC